MIRILESINIDSLKPKIQEIINKITKPLADNVIVTYIDETLMPNELSIEFAWEHKPGTEEYIGTWDIDMNKENISDYSKYLNDISIEIQTACDIIYKINS